MNIYFSSFDALATNRMIFDNLFYLVMQSVQTEDAGMQQTS